MFIQIIQGKIDDADRFHREADRWVTDLKPGASGYLGCTWGVAPDGTGFLLARFESEEAARANSDRPEQGAWWADMEKAFDQVEFIDCPEVDTMMGGGSDEAGFVQVIHGRAKAKDKARAMMSDAEEQLAEGRPDILGGLVAWHGDDAEFTQIVYFRTEAEARTGERSQADSEVDEQYREMMAGEPTFVDLTQPRFD
jgi:hypothetical protein